MKKLILFIVTLFWLGGCASAPEPFELGERTTAPFGYKDLERRDNR